jgi:hypothetical protein
LKFDKEAGSQVWAFFQCWITGEEMHMKRRLWLILIINLLVSRLVAEPLEGPYIYQDSMGAAMVPDDGDAPFSTARRSLIEARVFVPFSVIDPRFLLVPQIQYNAWAHAYQDNGTERILDRRVLIPGLIAALDSPDRTLRLFTLYNHFQHPNRFGNGLAMHEAVIGLDLDGYLNSVKPDFARGLQTRILYRYRQFPGHVTHLKLISGGIETQDGWIFSAGFPSHLRIGKWEAGYGRYLGAEVAAEARNAPADEGAAGSWLEGFQIAATMQWRERIYRNLFSELKVGAITERVVLMDELGDLRWYYQSAFAPYLMVKVTTFFDSI